MHDLYLTLIVVVFSIAGSLWIATHRRRQITPEAVLRRMHAHPLEGMEELLTLKPTPIDNRTFWEATGGARGLWRRYQNARGFTLICQYAMSQGFADEAEMQEMRDNAREVLLTSMVAILELTLAPFSATMSATHGLESLQAYWKMSQLVFAITSAEGFDLPGSSIARFL